MMMPIDRPTKTEKMLIRRNTFKMYLNHKKTVHQTRASQSEFNVFTNSSPEIFSLFKKVAPFTSGHVKLFFLGRVNVRVSTYFKSVTIIIIMLLSIYKLSSISHRIFFDYFLASDNLLSIFFPFRMNVCIYSCIYIYSFMEVNIFVVLLKKVTFTFCGFMIAFPLINNISNVCV